MSSSGPDHAKVFTARAVVAGRIFAACTGRSKKQAEQAAAESAWRVITAVEGSAPAADGTAGSRADPAVSTSA
jgi:ribonuclease-3